ncbi:MAG: M23 family metallopeptidase, partial [Clostridiales bacterium]
MNRKYLLATFFSAVLFLTCFANYALALEGKTAYRTLPGETIATIAQKKSQDGQLLAAMNNIASLEEKIPAQTIIWLPQDPQIAISVKKGDNAWSISQKYGLDIDAFLAINDLEKDQILQVGQQLAIPLRDEISSNRAERLSEIVLASRGEKNKISPQAIAEAEKPAPEPPQKPAAKIEEENYIWPVEGPITSSFGPRKSGFHHGLDIAAEQGSVIKAAKSGKVIFAGWKNNIYGNTVIIAHHNQQETLYAYSDKVLVKED